MSPSPAWTPPASSAEPLLRSSDLISLLAAPRPDAAALHDALGALAPASVPRLLDRLVYHRVDGLAWRSVSALPGDAADPWLRATLRRHHQQRAAAALAQGIALAELLEELDRRACRVAVMRGLRATEHIYKDAGARPFDDHDLLIHPQDEPAARDTLRVLRYEEAAPGLFRRATVNIDLHVDPLGARRRPTRARHFPIDVAALFERARPGWVAGGPALILPDEDDLVLMALHVVKHSFDRLVRTADLAHFVAFLGAAVCWEGVRERAAEAQALRLVGLALGAAEMLGVTTPAPVRLAGGAAGLEGLLLRRVAELRPLPYGGEVLMALAAPRLRDRLAFLWDALAPRGEAPEGGFRPADASRRTVVLIDHALRQARERRRAS